MGKPIGTSEKKTNVTISPANMLAKRRMVSESTRARWLTISMEHQRRQSRHGPQEVLQVADSAVLKSLTLVVDEGTNSAAQRNDGHAVGDSKPGTMPIRLQNRMKRASTARNAV